MDGTRKGRVENGWENGWGDSGRVVVVFSVILHCALFDANVFTENSTWRQSFTWTTFLGLPVSSGLGLFRFDLCRATFDSVVLGRRSRRHSRRRCRRRCLRIIEYYIYIYIYIFVYKVLFFLACRLRNKDA